MCWCNVLQLEAIKFYNDSSPSRPNETETNIDNFYDSVTVFLFALAVAELMLLRC